MDQSPHQGPPASPSVDVVVITWDDDPAMVRRAVCSALDQPGVPVHVQLVDNGSAVPVPAPTDPRVRLLRSERNLGVAAGRNLGARAGRSPLVCFLDSDAVLRPGSLARLVAAATSPGVGLSAPVFAGQAAEASAGRAPGLRVKAARALGRRGTYEAVPHGDGAVWPVDFAIGACQVVRRSAFEQVGGLDEGYFYGPEDVDFCLRLAEAGWASVQVAGAPVDHPPRRRYRRPLDRQGLRHAWAVLRHLRRHRRQRPAGVVAAGAGSASGAGGAR